SMIYIATILFLISCDWSFITRVKMLPMKSSPAFLLALPPGRALAGLRRFYEDRPVPTRILYTVLQLVAKLYILRLPGSFGFLTGPPARAILAPCRYLT